MSNVVPCYTVLTKFIPSCVLMNIFNTTITVHMVTGIPSTPTTHRTTDCFDEQLINASTTDQGKFCGKRVGEVFLFAKINKRIRGLQLMMENILNVWRYCSQFNFVSSPNKLFCRFAVKTCVSRKLHKKQLSVPAERLLNKTYNIYWVTLKLQLFSSNSVKFHLKCSFMVTDPLTVVYR